MSAFKDFRDDLLDKLVEKDREEFDSQLESFDSYKARTKAKYAENLDNYSESVQHGYDVIIDQLSHKLK